MFSVTAIANKVKQPKGGYIPISRFKKTTFQDGKTLNSKENLSGNIIGRVVDYLTRFLIDGNSAEAFAVALEGAKLAGRLDEALQILDGITGLNDETINSAVSLMRFDTVRRTFSVKHADEQLQLPDSDTKFNIIVMVNRSIQFLSEYGPVVLSGFTFEGGYTPIITSGDGDYLTEDTIWDFKVLKSEPTSIHSLQVYMYYLMGLNSIHPEFVEVVNLGFYNPRSNTVYQLPISAIEKSVLEKVYTEILMYHVSSEYIDVTIDELKWYQRNKLSAKKVRIAAKEKRVLDNKVYQDAVLYDRFLLKQVPINKRDETVCLNALDYNDRRIKERLGRNSYYYYESSSLVDLTDTELEKLLALVPESSKTEEFYSKLICHAYERSIDYVPLEAYTPKVLKSLFEHARSESKSITLKLMKETTLSQEMFDLMALYGFIKEIPTEKRNRTTYLNAVSINSRNMKLVPEEFQNYEFYTDAVAVNPGAIAYIPQNQLDDKLIISSLSRAGKNIKYISPENENYLEYCRIAITNTKSAKKYIPEIFIADELSNHIDETSEKKSTKS